jgi:hypothetical protein
MKKIHDIASVLADLWCCPARWRRRLEQIDVPELLDEIEKEAVSRGVICIPPPTIAGLVHRRVILTIRWRKTRCLLSGMLLLYLIARTRRTVTLHLECSFSGDNKLSGHCWISSPDIPEAGQFLPSKGMAEMYSKTIRPMDSNGRNAGTQMFLGLDSGPGPGLPAGKAGKDR